MTDEPTPPPAEPTASATRPISVRLGLASALFQGALVVLGVILGFLVTEWQADGARRAEARHALASILEELAVNRDAIAAARDYHLAKMGVIEAAARDNVAPEIRAFDRGFVSPAQVSSAAWTSAAETGALANLPFDQVLALGRVYGQQAAYVTQQSTVATILYGEMFKRGTDGILEHATGLRSIIGTFFYREQQLAAAYEKTLAEITIEE